jgi:hypothetical protein
MAVYGFPALGRPEDWRELAEEVALVCAFQRVGLMPERVARHRSLGIPGHLRVAGRHPLSMVAAKAAIGIRSAVTRDVPPRIAVMGDRACPVRTFRRARDGGMRPRVAGASRGVDKIVGELHDDNSR